MAKVTWQDPVASIKGKLGEKSPIIFRQKTIRDESGHILKVLPQEAFIVEHPRNWDKHPASDAEKQRINRWRKACQQAKAILADEEQKALWRNASKPNYSTPTRKHLSIRQQKLKSPTPNSTVSFGQSSSKLPCKSSADTYH